MTGGPAPRPDGPRVRAATEHDVAAVIALEVETLGPDAWPEQLVAEGVGGAVPTVHYLVAEKDILVVGYAATSVVAGLAELQRLAVAAPHRRRGVATALVQAVCALAAEGHAEGLLLEVRDDNAGALAFYADRGFTEIDRRVRYYRDGTTARVLRLDVRAPAVRPDAP